MKTRIVCDVCGETIFSDTSVDKNYVCSKCGERTFTVLYDYTIERVCYAS